MTDLGSDDAATVRNALASMIERIDVSAKAEQRGKKRVVIDGRGVVTFKSALALTDIREAP